MAKPINLMLFGDQTVEKLSSIQSLVRNSKTSAGARRLLREATDALQLNLAKLAKGDRAWNHEIKTLIGLAEDNIAEKNRNGVIATVLMCIGRLGELIVLVHKYFPVIPTNLMGDQVCRRGPIDLGIRTESCTGLGILHWSPPCCCLSCCKGYK
jgi:Starter unit:ACP transacylase in aflatoxin biosynthesis